jgi:hypothetical protein
MIKTNKPQLTRPATESLPEPSPVQVTYGVLLQHGERILFEVPRVLRRIGLFFLIMTISIPVFFAGLLVVLWHFAG